MEHIDNNDCIESQGGSANEKLERLRLRYGIYKTLLGTVLVGILGVVIPGGIDYLKNKSEERWKERELSSISAQKEKELTILSEQKQQEYIRDFLDTALNQDIELRIRFAKYFSDVSPGKFKNNWKILYDSLLTSREDIRSQINEKESKLHKLLSKTDLTEDEQIEIEQLERELEWRYKEVGYVAKNRSVVQSKQEEKTEGKTSSCGTAGFADGYTLAMLWQPGFCEHSPQNLDKPECNALNTGGLSIGHLTLNGLWPNKSDCGTKYGNCGNTPLDLEEDTLSALAPWMPNCYYANPLCKLAEYEWKKHGTCQERDDDTYFKLAIDILQRVDKSEIGKYLKDNIGETISIEAYRKHIEETMGKEVADRMLLVCPKGQKGYLQEIRLQFPKVIVVDDNISKMVAGANTFGGKFATDCSDKIYIERSGRD